MIADDEFRVWALRTAASMIRTDATVEAAVAHLEDVADRLTCSYIEDATEGRAYGSSPIPMDSESDPRIQ